MRVLARARGPSVRRPLGGSRNGGRDWRHVAGARRDRRGSPQRRRRTTCCRRGARGDWDRKATGGDDAYEAQARRPRNLPRAGSGRGEDGGRLFAEVERAIGAENACRDRVAGPKIFSPAPLRLRNSFQNWRLGSGWTMRRTGAGGRRRAQPLGVPISSASPGAILAKVLSRWNLPPLGYAPSAGYNLLR